MPVHRFCDDNGKKGMVLFKDTEDNSVLFVVKSALSKHNETFLLLFNRWIMASCMEQLFNLVSL